MIVKIIKWIFRIKPPQKYVAGFMFSGLFTEVALIRKNKPAWQRGKLNGIGGKIEEGESGIDAMVREFREETGFEWLCWSPFCTMTGKNDDGSKFSVDFFACCGPISELKSNEEEKVGIYPTNEIYALRPDVIENLPWLIAAAIDHLQDGRPAFINATYK